MKITAVALSARLLTTPVGAEQEEEEDAPEQTTLAW